MSLFMRSLDEIPLNGKIAIYGASTTGKRVHELVRSHRSDVSIVCYLDTYKSGSIGKLPIVELSNIKQHLDEFDLILVASVHWPSICQSLRERNISGFLVYDDVIHLPEYYGSMVLQEKTKHLALAVQYARIVGGDIAEFGVAHGETAAILSAAVAAQDALSGNNRTRLLLFDSFEGLPEALSRVDQDMPHVRSGAWKKGTFRVENEHDVIDRVLAGGIPKERLDIYKGWFESTLPTLPKETRLAMLHIDCDLYQSTHEVLCYCLEHGYVAPGAIVCFDDWNATGADPNYGERKAWADIISQYNINYSDEGCYSWHGHKFIIHSYVSGSGQVQNSK